MPKLIIKPFTLILLALLVGAPRAQQTSAPASITESNADRVALHQALLDLTDPWTVMCVAAHPDDEDGTSLIVMRRKFGAHTVSLFSTFGEGGQNAIGPELYEEMGAIRARETMAAAEIQGSEPYFLGLKDFGFSKSADEAFKMWGHDEALRRMVLKIRQLRPDVIITNHDTTSGHGHHQATGRLVLEAFDAAADSKRFPEQLKDGLEPWQVQRLFVRAGFGNRNPSGGAADNAGVVTIDPNERDPVSGTIYAEQALMALQKHATQGPWPKSFADMLRFRNSQDGKLPLIRYRLVRYAKDSDGATSSPAFDGANSHNFFEGLKLPKEIATELEKLTIAGRPLVDFADDRTKVMEQLLQYGRRGTFRFGPDWLSYLRLSLFREKVDRAIAAAAGVSIQAEAPNKVVTPASTVELKIRIVNAGQQTISVSDCSSDLPSLRKPVDRTKLQSGATSILSSSASVSPHSTLDWSNAVTIPRTAPINLPLASHLYEPMALGLQITTRCNIGIGQVAFGINLQGNAQLDVSSPVEIAGINPSPLVVRPPEVGVSSAGADVFPPPSPTFNLRLINHLDKPFKGELVVAEESGAGGKRDLELLPHQSTSLAITIPSPAEKTVAAHRRDRMTPDSVLFTVRADGSRESITSRQVPVIWANAHVAHQLHVGYVRGFDFSLENALTALGVEAKELSVADVSNQDLQRYSTIIVDNRVYESRPELIAVNQKLLDYAKDGGTLVVFYHKSNEWNPNPRVNRPQLAPYPLTLGDERITDENAPVTFLEADHPLLNFPNKIGQEDFEGWIQERGLYYPKEWDAHYHALLAANDPGEAPLRGGLLVADYGKGHYIYTSMVWYRQLRAGVPGGYRMFANMISYGHQ